MKLVWVPQTFSLSDHPKWQDLVVSYVRKSVPRGRGQVALENSRRQHRFSREMMSVKRLQKFHTDDVSAPKSLVQISLVGRSIRSTTQRLSVWNFCARSSDVNYRENQCGAANCRLFSKARGWGGGEERGTREVLPLWGLWKKPVCKGRTWIPPLKVKDLILHLIIVA